MEKIEYTKFCCSSDLFKQLIHENGTSWIEGIGSTKGIFESGYSFEWLGAKGIWLVSTNMRF